MAVVDPPRFGVLLPTFDVVGGGGGPDAFPVVAAARRAEALGFDSVWAGDHLICHAPVLDSLCALAAVAAVTTRIELGLSVLQLALRSPAWAAKQLTTIDALAPGRLRLGVGAGGEYPDEFVAAGVPANTRGKRLDALLSVLPALLRGERVDEDSPELVAKVAGLRPPITVLPRISVGGRGAAALRRAVRFGDQWLAMWHSPGVVRERAATLAALAAELDRPTPSIGLLVMVSVNDDVAAARRDARTLVEAQYRLPLDAVERWTPIGPARHVARLLGEYRDAGVGEFVLMPAGRDPIDGYERCARMRDLVTGAMS